MFAAKHTKTYGRERKGLVRRAIFLGETRRLWVANCVILQLRLYRCRARWGVAVSRVQVGGFEHPLFIH